MLTTTFPRWKDDIEPPFVYELCRRLTDFEIHVIAPHAPGSRQSEIMDGIHVHRFRYAPEKLETLAFDGGIAANLKRSRWKYLLLQGFLLSQFFLAYRIARQHQIHLIHAHWMIPTGLIGATLRELLPGKNRLLITAHGGDVHQLRGTIFQKLRRWVAQEADCVSVVSRSLEEKAAQEQWPAHDIAIAPMGVDLHSMFVPAPRTSDTPTVVFAGRLVPKKGVPHLLEAMHRVATQMPDCRLLIAGDGPLRELLQARAKTLGLASQVEFLGRYHLHDLPAIFQRGDIAVLPFDTAKDGDAEGLGLTAVEAMGCGLPTIVGDVPAIHDVVIHKKNGLIVDPRNTTELAHQIVDLLNNPKTMRKYAANGRTYCLQNFDWEICAQRYTDLLKGIATSNTKAEPTGLTG